MSLQCCCRIAVLSVGGFCAAASGLWADSVRLANGDTLSGEVVSLDTKQLKIKSQLLGEITIARAKVQTITLGDGLVPPALNAPAGSTAPRAGTGSLSVEELLKQLGG